MSGKQSLSLARDLPLFLAMQKKGFVQSLKLMQAYAEGQKSEHTALIEQMAQAEEQELGELVKLLPKRLGKVIQLG